MRIGIDFHAAEREGTGNCVYIKNTVENLLNIDSENTYILYITDRKNNYYSKFSRYNNVEFSVIPFKNPFIRIPLLGIKTFIDKIDLLHVQYMAPPVSRGRLVTSIHDVSFLHFPDCFRTFERIRLKLLIPFNIMISDRILTISEFSKKDIIDNYKVKESNISVVYCGANENYKVMEVNESLLNEISKYGIAKNYIFFVGRLDVRKNIESLIKAYLLLRNKGEADHQLVIVGKKDFMTESLLGIMRDSDYEGEIIFTGFIPDKDLPKLYNCADIFVYPSLYEGFGLPCLEAMSCGCPVVSSNISSIPEVVGEAGILVDPEKIDELEHAINTILSNRDLRNELSEKGLQQSKKFSWEKSAKETLAIYKELL